MRILRSGLEALLLALFPRVFSGPGIQLPEKIDNLGNVDKSMLTSVRLYTGGHPSFLKKKTEIRIRVQVDFTIAW